MKLKKIRIALPFLVLSTFGVANASDTQDAEINHQVAQIMLYGGTSLGSAGLASHAVLKYGNIAAKTAFADALESCALGCTIGGFGAAVAVVPVVVFHTTPAESGTMTDFYLTENGAKVFAKLPLRERLQYIKLEPRLSDPQAGVPKTNANLQKQQVPSEETSTSVSNDLELRSTIAD